MRMGKRHVSFHSSGQTFPFFFVVGGKYSELTTRGKLRAHHEFALPGKDCSASDILLCSIKLSGMFLCIKPIEQDELLFMLSAL